jgi:hypothetical protein
VTWYPRLSFYSPIRENFLLRPTENASRSLVLYGSMIADDIVIQSRVVTLIEALDATLVALSSNRVAEND